MKLQEKKAFWSALKSGEFESLVKETVKGESLSNSIEVFNLLRPLMSKKQDVEQAWFIFLNAKNKVIEVKKMFQGSITSSAIYPREVIKQCLKNKAAAVIMAHNHPSGCCKPSKEDYDMTFSLVIAFKVMGITLHEHMVIADSYYSFADNGDMDKLNHKYSHLTGE